MESGSAIEKGGKELNGKGKGKDGKKKDAEELSEEDEALKEGLELAVTRLKENEKSLHKQALDHLVNEIRSATSSMTSVPKPLKFLNAHYATLKGIYESWPGSHELKTLMADMMSVLAMTMSERGSFECLKFKLAGTQVNIASWGHEYVRYLSGEISEEYNRRILDEAEVSRNLTKRKEVLNREYTRVFALVFFASHSFPFFYWCASTTESLSAKIPYFVSIPRNIISIICVTCINLLSLY